MNRCEKLFRLIGAVRYELAAGIHTFGLCSRCHDKSARGGGICADCRVEELGKLVGNKLARRFQVATKNVVQSVDEMEEKLSE